MAIEVAKQPTTVKANASVIIDQMVMAANLHSVHCCQTTNVVRATIVVTMGSE